MDQDQKALMLSRFDQLLDEFDSAIIEVHELSGRCMEPELTQAAKRASQARERIMVELRDLIGANPAPAVVEHQTPEWMTFADKGRR